MLKKYLEFSFAFAIIFIAELLSIFYKTTTDLILGDFNYLIKPSIVISLMIFYAYQTQLKGRFAKRIFTGLFLGLVGDCLLMFVHVNESFFILGLIAFLLWHLVYIGAFYLDFTWNRSIERKSIMLAVVMFGLFCLGFYAFLRPHLGGMKIPVWCYSFVIALMAIMAVSRKGRVATVSFWLIFFGSLLFLISDSLLAFNKFVDPFAGGDIAIMATYMLAQYLITVGAIERILRKSVAMGAAKSN